jgi:DNA-binding CsgD family transcriptional regulator
MVAQLTVSEQDLRTLLEIVNLDRDDSPANALPASLLIDLMGLLRCDCVTFVGLDSAEAATWAVQGQPTADFLANPETFWGSYWKCESCSYPDRRGDLRSVTEISDFYSTRQWHATAHYGDNVRPAGFEHKLQVSLPAAPGTGRPGRSVQLAFWREPGPDFSERDRALLSLLRPHLYQAYLDAARRRTDARQLTPRQMDLLRLVAGGYTNSQIGSRLGISEGTVRKHLENIYGRLQVSSRTAAVTRAFPDLPGVDGAGTLGASMASSGRR